MRPAGLIHSLIYRRWRNARTRFGSGSVSPYLPSTVVHTRSLGKERRKKMGQRGIVCTLPGFYWQRSGPHRLDGMVNVSLHHGGTIMKAPFHSDPTSADAADAAIYVQTNQPTRIW